MSENLQSVAQMLGLAATGVLFALAILILSVAAKINTERKDRKS
jgi:hypothetical protein